MLPRGSLAGLPAGTPSGPEPAFRQASSAQFTDGNEFHHGGYIAAEQGDFKALGTGSKSRRIGRGEAGAKNHLDLADAADAEHAQNAIQHDIHLGLLPGFARSTFS